VIEFREISDRADDLLILDRFYKDLYESEFPDPDERESLANMKEYLRLKAQGWYGENNYHLLIALEDGRLCGGVISDFLADAGAGAIEFLVVDQQQRGSGLGRSLLEQTERLLAADAKRVGRELTCVVAEMNDPFKPGALDDCFDPFLRAQIWDRWGYARLEFPYLQPALSSDQNAVSHLMLVAKPMRAAWRDAIPSATVKAVLAGYMRWAMRLENPESVPEYRQASDYIDQSPTVGLTSLSAYVGKAPSPPLSISEVRGVDDPSLDRVLAVYRAAFPGGPSDLDPEGFRQALKRSRIDRSRYHLWAVRSVREAPIEGVASFFTFPTGGFGGYIALTGALKGTRRSPLLLALIEEQMLRDRLGARGWYIECAAAQEALFKTMGFHTVDIEYRQPPLSGGAASTETPILALMYKDFGRHFAVPSLSAEDFLAAMRSVFDGVYQIASPSSSSSYRHLEAQVSGLGDGAVRFR
jgi:GNAT superfamily N-acetyltransferase